MENNPFTRTERLFGKEAMERLASSCVAIFGLGGVGGNCCEALARNGVGHFVLVDDDTVSLSNINRQLIATFDTIGMNKVDVMEQRIHSINPQAIIEKRKRCDVFFGRYLLWYYIPQALLSRYILYNLLII